MHEEETRQLEEYDEYQRQMLEEYEEKVDFDKLVNEMKQAKVDPCKEQKPEGVKSDK